MFTTRRLDGRLVSRPMATQERGERADFWFVTDGESHKLDELQHDPHVNLSYYRDRTREWVSVSGTARVSQRPRADPRACTSRTGRPGSATRAAPATAGRTIRAWRWCWSMRTAWST